MMLKRMKVMLLLPLMIAALSLFLVAPSTQAIEEVTPTPDLPEITPTELPDSGADITELLDEAITLIESEDYEGALDVLNEAIELNAANVDAYVWRGITYANLENYTRAIDDYTRALNLRPYDATVYVLRGNAYFSLGETGEAMLDYDLALEYNHQYLEAYRNRSFLHYTLENNAEGALDELLATGLEEYQSQDYRSAIDDFTEVIETDDGATRATAYAYYLRGQVYFELEDIESALEDFTTAAEYYPEMHDAYMSRGYVQAQEGDVEGAGQSFYRRMEIIEQTLFEDEISIGDDLDIAMDYGYVYHLTFEGLGGESITIEARDNDASGVDPLIVLVDPDGTPIAGDDDNGGSLDSQMRVRLPSDGTYTLWVSHANGGYVGEVRVTVR
jgi:tetratricopeptide (TPR) repeat protein